MKRWIKTAAMAAVCTAAPFLTSLSAEPLSLENAVQLAIEHSPALRAQTSTITANTFQRSAARTGVLPQISLAATYQRINPRDPLNLSIPLPAPYGPQELQLGERIEDSISASVEVVQPIYTGGSIRRGVELASIALQASAHQLSAARRDVIHDTRGAYWRVVEAEQRVTAIEERVAQVASAVADMTNRRNAGLVTQNTLLEVQMAQAETEMQYLRATNAREIAIARLKMLTGIASGTSVVLSAELPDETAYGDPTLAELITRALDNRSDLAAIRLAAVAKNAETRAIASGRLPHLYATGAFSVARPAPDLFPANYDFGTTWNVGILGKYDLGSQPRVHYSAAASKEQQSAAAANISAAEEGIALEVQMNLLEWKTANEEVRVAGTIVQQNRENLQEMLARLDAGTALRTEVLDAESLLLEAKLSETSARVNRQIAWETLMRSTGELE